MYVESAWTVMKIVGFVNETSFWRGWMAGLILFEFPTLLQLGFQKRMHGCGPEENNNITAASPSKRGH